VTTEWPKSAGDASLLAVGASVSLASDPKSLSH